MKKLLSKLKFTQPLRNQSGMAMLIAIFSLMLLVFVATEVSYQTHVEYVSASQEVNRLKAHYAAKAGVEIGLLRILIYKKALATFGENLGENKSMLDPIWNFPFAWPPIIPDDLAGAEKDEIQSSVKESSMKGNILTTIESEGGKIDINDLGSPSKALAEGTKQQLLKIFSNEIEINDDFADKHSSVNFEELVNNIIDWIDEDTESLNGGDESGYYKDDLVHEMIPPNASLKTLEELHMITGMTDEFYDLLFSKITIFGSMGINVNYAAENVLMSLDPQITKQYASLIISRRQDKEKGGLFKDEDEFIDFLGGGEINIDVADFNKDGIPLLFSEEQNFRIISTGNFANATNEITVITYDMDNLRERMITLLDKDDETNGEGEGNEDNNDNNNQTGPPPPEGEAGKTEKDKEKAKIKIPKGRPTVVYWEEL